MTNKTFKVIPKDDYAFLTSLCNQNELEEMNEDDLQSVVKAWQLVDLTGDAKGGVCVLRKSDEYVIDCLGIAPDQRKAGYGKQLIDTAVNYIKENNGKRIFIVTKIPLYFMRIGFALTSKKNAPDFSDCFSCRRYDATCFPEVMQLELD